MDRSHLKAIFDRLPVERQRGHPLESLLVIDGTTAVTGLRTERAFRIVESRFRNFFISKISALVEDREARNASATLGEMRTLADLISIWGDKLEIQQTGADFRIHLEALTVSVEAATCLGSTVNTRFKGESVEYGSVRVTESSTAPFGYPVENKPGDTIQGNAISRLAAVKQDEHQISDTGLNLLWIDLEDPNAFPLPIGVNQTQPLIGGGFELVSGACWWANYGKKGDPIFDSWPISEFGARQYRLEFDCRYERRSWFDGVIYSLEGIQVLHENHLRNPLPVELTRSLLGLPGARLELWWTSWPTGDGLQEKVSLARSNAEALAQSEPT